MKHSPHHGKSRIRPATAPPAASADGERQHLIEALAFLIWRRLQQPGAAPSVKHEESTPCRDE